MQFVVHQFIAHLIDVERNLRNQDHIRVPRDTAIESDKAGIAPHHFHHHHPIMGLGGGMQAVNGLGGDADRRIEPEGNDGPPHVVVDGFWNTYHRHPLGGKAVSNIQTPIPTDGNKCIKAKTTEVFHDPVRQIARFPFSRRIADRHIKGVALVGCSQNSAADTGNAVDLFRSQIDYIISIQKAGIAAFNAVNLPLSVVGCHGDRLNDSVQSRSVTAAGIDADFHPL